MSRQHVPCSRCDGSGRVGILRKSVPLFQGIVMIPTQVSFMEASKIIGNFQGRGLETILVRSMLTDLQACPCPDCKGSGVCMTLIFGKPVRNS